MPMGVTALPSLLPIFLPLSARIHPLIATLRQGICPSCSMALAIV